MELADRVGNEVHKDSLASLRREMLKQNSNLLVIQSAAATTAAKLNQQISNLREFNDALVSDANASAASTIFGSRVATVVVTLIGLALAITSGMRVRQSVRQLREQNEALESLSRQLASANTTLEATVAERTASLQMILDNTGEGVLSVDLQGRLLPERSAIVTRWCGKAPADATLWDYLGAEDSQFASNLEMAFMQIVEEVFPFEVAAAQAPPRFQRHGRTFSLASAKSRKLGARATCSSSFATSLNNWMPSESSENRGTPQADRQSLEGSLWLPTTSGRVRAFNRVAGRQSRSAGCQTNSAYHQRQHRHPGLSTLGRWTHEIESNLAEENRLPSTQEYHAMRELWKQSLINISDYLTIDRSDTVELHPQHLAQLRALACESQIAEEIMS